MTVKTANDAAIAEAAAIIRAGGLVGMPTETVYGLAGNALDGKAVAKIFEAKGRPQFNPLIIHCSSAEQAAQHVMMDARAKNLAAKFWPGPLSMILPRANGCKISELACAGLPTLAVRVPGHPVARKLIEQAGVPIAAPSANISGSISPTTPQHVAEGLGDKLDIILAAGACEVGLESTVVDMTGLDVVILRPGAITAEDIEAALDEKVTYELDSKDKVKSPGQLLKHYAPSVPLRMNAVDVNPGEALLAFGSIKFMGVKGVGSAKDMNEDLFRNLSETGDLHEAAANLFAMLKQLDKSGPNGIAVMSMPETGLGIAINDRLKRAAAGSKVDA
jgi:L-threonylcarbamoyladenylate synthase